MDIADMTVSLTYPTDSHEILNFTTARKSGNILLTYLETFFILHSSEYETSDSNRKFY